MERFIKFTLLFFLLHFAAANTWCQANKKTVLLAPNKQPVKLDSAVVYTPSFLFSSKSTFPDTISIAPSAYFFDPTTNFFTWIIVPPDTLYLRFQVFTFVQQSSYRRYTLQTTNTGNDLETERAKFQLDKSNNSDFFGGNSMHKSGSLARGIGFGNNQSLGLNSALNLQLNGQVTPNLQLTAALSDANIPFQASGTTNQ